MTLATLIDFYIHPEYFGDPDQLRRARLFVKGCLLTSLFSSSYVWLSILFEYDKGIFMMLMNVVGFLILPLLAKTKLPISWLGNAYVAVGATAVIVLTHFSGGIWSAIYPWIAVIPLLALLMVNKLSGAIWGVISLTVMVVYGVLANAGVELPMEYNTGMRAMWFTSILTGLLLLILFVGFVFEYVQTRALKELKQKNDMLEEQAATITAQSSELEKLIEEKDYIIRILAHDLRSPLSNINGLTGLMSNEKYDRQQGEFVSMVKKSANQALHLIEQVLEMDKADQRDLQVGLEAVDIVETISEQIDSMKEIATKKQITIKLDNQCQSCRVRGERIYLVLVFDNLLSNAIKFSDSGTQVQVCVASTESSVIVKISDEGPGILPEEEKKLFKKFSRLSARPTANESSSGLGLSLVKRYVELLQGKIWYERSGTPGATFVVELPLV